MTGEFLVSPFFIWLWKGIVQAFQRIFKSVPIPKLKEVKFRSTVLPEAKERDPSVATLPGNDNKNLVKPVPAAVKPNIHIVAAPKTEQCWCLMYPRP